MSVWQFSLAIGALAALVFAQIMKQQVEDDNRLLKRTGVKRSTVFVFMMVACFVASVAWQRAELPYHAAAVLAFDAALCLSIDALAKEKWEAMLFNVYRLSVLLSVSRLFGFIDNTTLYVIGMELCNWVAIALVIGTATVRMEPVHGDVLRNSWARNIHRLNVYLRSPRKADHWSKVRS